MPGPPELYLHVNLQLLDHRKRHKRFDDRAFVPTVIQRGIIVQDAVSDPGVVQIIFMVTILNHYFGIVKRGKYLSAILILTQKAFFDNVNITEDRIMQKTIEAVYEHGVLRPLHVLDLREHEKVRITLEKSESVARASSGIIKGLDDKTIDEIALSPEFLPEEA